MKATVIRQRGWFNGRLALCAAAVIVAGLQFGQSVAPAYVSLRQLAADQREVPQDQDEHDDAPQDVAITEQMTKVVLRRNAWSPRPTLVAVATHHASARDFHPRLTPRDASRGTLLGHPSHCPPLAVRLLI